MPKPKTPVTNNTNSSEVVSRVLSESVLSIAQARSEISKITGRHPDKSSIIRWIKARKLDGVRLGRQLVHFNGSIDTIHCQANRRVGVTTWHAEPY